MGFGPEGRNEYTDDVLTGWKETWFRASGESMCLGKYILDRRNGTSSGLACHLSRL